MENVVVMSKAEARRFSYKIKENPDGKKYAIISISNIGDDANHFARSDAIIGILRLYFNDVDGRNIGAMHMSDAEKILEFMKRIGKKVNTVIVHCEAGVSRSAGVAAALLDVYKHDGNAIFQDSRYCPNMHCYRMVMDAYEDDTMPEEVRKSDNLCEKCRKLIVQDVITDGKCRICGKKFLSGHSPANVICDECIRFHNRRGIYLCRQCGWNIIVYAEGETK